MGKAIPPPATAQAEADPQRSEEDQVSHLVLVGKPDPDAEVPYPIPRDPTQEEEYNSPCQRWNQTPDCPHPPPRGEPAPRIRPAYRTFREEAKLAVA